MLRLIFWFFDRLVGLGWILGVINNVDTREISPVLAREGVEVGLVSSRGTDEGRFDEVLKDGRG